MKNLPENSTTPNAGPVGHNGEASVSKLPAAHPICAADALLLPTRADLNAHWLKSLPPYSAVRSWHDLIQWLAVAQPEPALN